MKNVKILGLFLIFSFFCFQSHAQDSTATKNLYHVLLLQFKDSIDIEVKNETIRLFEGLPAKVEGLDKIDILELTVSRDEYDAIVIQQYSSEEALERYRQHADHARIVEIGMPLLSKFSEFDYWK